MRTIISTVSALAFASACHMTDGTLGNAPDAGVSGDGSGSAIAVPQCSGKPILPHDLTWTIESGGLPRVANVHIPEGYDPTVGTPLVLNIHGFTSDAVEEALLTNMTPKADAENFVVVYPYGTGVPGELSWNAGACCGTAAATNVNDIGFVSDLIDYAEQQLCIDPSRVFATGMSNGGFLSHTIGCELADRVAAIAPVAGVDGMPTCTPSRPVPVMHFHGTADPLVPWNGDALLGFISVPDSIAGWAQRDGCTGSPVQTYANGNSTCATYQQCAGGADVTLCTIAGGGHTWPGGLPVPVLGMTTTDISATDAMWTFFQAHPLP
jgi:polyhydroxybutyrate depolymerase